MTTSFLLRLGVCRRRSALDSDATRRPCCGAGSAAGERPRTVASPVVGSAGGHSIRPHRALGRPTPAQAYAARPKAQPRLTKIDTSHWRTRQDKVDKSGIVTLRHNSRLHHIGVGRSRTKVLLLAKDLDVRIIHRDTGELLHELVLNPAKDYQPQAKP